MSNEAPHTALWNKAAEFLRNNLSEQQYTAWFSDVRSLSFDTLKRELKISVPSSYFIEVFENNFKSVLNSAIKKIYGQDVKLIYCYPMVNDVEATRVSERSPGISPVIAKGGAAPANPFVNEPPRAFDSQLNASYNFENYVKGDSNLIACTIAEAIADDPTNKTFNPLFIFGPTGVGKTHLIQAIGIRIKERNPAAKVLYVTARLFQSQYTAANHKGQINNFFHFYQGINTLIVDDIQDLAGKRETQNTFFNIFNQLHQNNRQIIMSSDCAPALMDGFEARLLSRFKWGASAELFKPDIDLRRKVLRCKAEQAGLELDDDIINYIADNVTDSIRELEGVISSLVVHAMALNCEITLSLAQNVIANSIRRQRRQINFEMLTQAVSSYFNLEADTLFTKSRKREISDARQIVMYLAKTIAGMSLKQIGNKLGRTHATVLYACKTIEERMPIEKELRASIDAIQQSILG